MDLKRHFTVHLIPEPEGGFTVRVPALPEVITCGDTYEEAMANAREATEAILELYRDEGWEIPDDVQVQVDHLTIAA